MSLDDEKKDALEFAPSLGAEAVVIYRQQAKAWTEERTRTVDTGLRPRRGLHRRGVGAHHLEPRRHLVHERRGSPSPEDQAHLARHGVAVCRDPVLAFEGDDDGLRGVRTASGTVPRGRCLSPSGQRARSPLAAMLGCEVEGDGVVETFDKQRTCVPGLYLAGDASHDVKFAIVAAAHGARAAHDINQALRQQDTV